MVVCAPGHAVFPLTWAIAWILCRGGLQCRGVNIPRRELTPEQAARKRATIAGAQMLDLPVISTVEQTGLVLDVASVGVTGPGFGDVPAAAPYLRCADGQHFRLPEALRDWAIDSVATHHALEQTGCGPMFPSKVEFGIFNGGAYAQHAEV